VDLVKSQKWTDSGLVILSKFRFIDQGQLVFTDATHLDKGASKGALFVRCKVDRGYLLIFNCHLQAEHGNSKYSAIRTKQLRQLRKFIAKTSNKYPKDPWMIGGDFNIDAITSDDHRLVLYQNDQVDRTTDSDDYKVRLGHRSLFV
jgi:endonuclease/exonuclease/phosphatase (EEP) superfamily protein YafD